MALLTLKYSLPSYSAVAVSYTHLDNLEGESYSIGNQKKLLTKVAKEKGYTNLAVSYTHLEHLAELRQQREADLSAVQEAAFALDNGSTLFIQTCDSGYDYTLYGDVYKRQPMC